jgi:hypothetical protein
MENKLHYWKEDGKWHCAIPRDDFATRHGFDWKHYGLIGRGKTKKQATEDWEKWQRAQEIVNFIY